MDNAIEALPIDSPSLARLLGNFRALLGKRFELNNDKADLDGAIEFTDREVSGIPTDHPDRASFLSNLGIVDGT
jgi:hypothetical protein